MSSKLDKMLVYVSRNRLDFYNQGVDVAKTLQFPAGLLQDLEIVNEAGLRKVISDFISTNKIEPARVIFILSSSVVFEKTFKKERTSMVDDDIEFYKNKVPFENVVSRAYDINDSMTVSVFNADIVSLLQSLFEEHNFVVEGFVPLSQIDQQAAASHSFAAVQAKSAFLRFGALRNLVFIKENPITHEPEEPKPIIETGMPEGSSRKRLYLMVGVFVLLIGVLAYMILTMTPK